MPRESLKNKKLRAAAVLEELQRLYPDAACELHFGSRFQFLVSVVLSAQTTDKKVNEVTPGLFAQWPDQEAMAQAPLEQIEAAIQVLGLFRSKAKNVQALSRALVDGGRYTHGDIPTTRAELEALPGVGRKTANVILANVPDGEPALAVDTHVMRLAGRLGFSRATEPVGIERDLCKLFPDAAWGFASHALIFHGRRVCDARKPACATCTLATLCPTGLRTAAAPKSRR